jgi:hypothetical protein
MAMNFIIGLLQMCECAAMILHKELSPLISNLSLEERDRYSFAEEFILLQKNNDCDYVSYYRV